jgi:transporter family protein
VQDIPSNLATGIRTIVILALSWAIVLARGEHRALGTVSRRSLVFLVLSGLATGVSWLAYYRALQLGPASRVAPIDKLSLAFTVMLAVPVLGEPLTLRVALGVGLMIAGALLTLR